MLRSTRWGGDRVNKKITCLAVVLMAAVMLVPTIGIVAAGKGQEKLSFKLVMIGHYSPPDRVVETKNTIHYIPLGFAFHNPLTAEPALTVEIDDTPLPAIRLGGGEGFLHLNVGPQGYTIQVTDVIIINDGAGSLMGNIVTNALGNLNKGEGQGAGMHFIGHGTDELKGVKVEGLTTSVEPIGEWTAPSGAVLTISRVTRVGTVMGWP